MKIGDEVYVHGYVDEIRTDVIIIQNQGGYFGTAPIEVLPKNAAEQTEPQSDDKKCTYAYDTYSEEWYPIYAKRKEDEPQTEREGE